MIHIQIKRLASGKDLPLPARATNGAAGFDLSAALEDGNDVILPPGGRVLLPTGFAIEIPEGYEGQVRPRSGLALRHGVTVLNSPGTIDSDYRGEIGVVLINHGSEPYRVQRGMRIAQLVIGPLVAVSVEEFASLGVTGRESGGFGSTG
jgi:dUTP pyrophosphatase